MSSPTEALSSIRKFIRGIEFDPLPVNFDNQFARQTYRRFHALLLWELVIDSEGNPPSVQLYFREFLSDCATAYYLNFVGIYKASRLCARGGIENLLRVLAASAGADIYTLNTIPGLLQGCREQWAATPERLEMINASYVQYGDLCSTVHSSAVDYMSLRVPFEKISEQNEEDYATNIGVLDNVFRLAGELIFLTYCSNLTNLHYKNADFIRDAVSGEIKRIAQEELNEK